MPNLALAALRVAFLMTSLVKQLVWGSAGGNDATSLARLTKVSVSCLNPITKHGARMPANASSRSWYAAMNSADRRLRSLGLSAFADHCRTPSINGST
jgi:hypothetical protein